MFPPPLSRGTRPTSTVGRSIREFVYYGLHVTPTRVTSFSLSLVLPCGCVAVPALSLVFTFALLLSSLHCSLSPPSRCRIWRSACWSQRTSVVVRRRLPEKNPRIRLHYARIPAASTSTAVQTRCNARTLVILAVVAHQVLVAPQRHRKELHADRILPRLYLT